MEHRLQIYGEKYGLRERMTTSMSPPNLSYCDTGELLKLLSTLGNLECSKLHIKINEYFWRFTKAVTFIIERIEFPQCMQVRAIGRVALDAPLQLKQECYFLQRATKSKQVERILRADLEGVLVCELERVLKEEYKMGFQNCFLCPVDHPTHTAFFPYFVVLLNAKDFFQCEKVYKGIVSECMRHSFGMIKSAGNYEEEKRLNDTTKAVLTAYVQIISSLGTDMIYHEIGSQCSTVLKGTSSSVFVSNLHGKLDMKSNSAPYYHAEDDTNNLTRHVYESGLPFNCKNPSEEPLFPSCGMTDVPRNLLAFPLGVATESHGVVQVFNKETPFKSFDKNDVELSRPLSYIASLAIDTHNMFEAFIRHREKLAYADCIFLRRTRLMDDYNAVLRVVTCTETHEYHRFGDVRFDPLSVPEDHVICFCYKIFKDLGFLKLFKIHKEKFIRFLLKVRHGYNALPFHGWLQAFATFHFTSACISMLNLTKNKYISPMEAFAMCVAALCHGLDHRGSTTMFQMTSGTVLASLFSSPGSIAQMHHASQTLRLMNLPQCNFLESLPDAIYITLASLIISMIKSFDISHNEENLKNLKELVCNAYDFTNSHHRRMIHTLILNFSQMNFICKDWSYCRKTGEHCFHEFFRKGDLSHASGVYEMSELNEDILKLPEMNSNFIETRCSPTFSAFKTIFPVMSMCDSKISKNLKYWREEKEKILAAMVQDVLGADTTAEEDD